MKSTALNRRQFLGQTAGLAASAVASGALSALPHPAQAAAALDGTRPHLSACIEAVFAQGPFEQRLEKVKASGLEVFEFWGWRGRNLESLAKAKTDLGLTLAAFSCDTGGALVAANSKERYLPALKDSLAAAKKLDCQRLIVTVGNELKDVPRADQHRNIVEALKAGAPLCEAAGVTICLEPLNIAVNHKGYYLASSAEAFQMVDEVGSPNLRVLFDLYHQQITEGNLIQNFTRNLKKIGHFHVADVPGRHQVGTGEIHYANVFKALVGAGYTGFVGLEMWPTIDHTAAVKQVAALFDDALKNPAKP